MQTDAPTAKQIHRFLDKHGITQTAAAAMCRLNPRTFRRYATGEQDIPYCVWFTLKVKVENGMEE